MDLSTFNEQQRKAILSPYDKDVIISAVAGSGKTRTLSYKVAYMIPTSIKPSELLVLTFTDNAAYEMKDRIIKVFKSEGKLDLLDQMNACHIQTFDSFCQQLVKKYASELNISSKINVSDEKVIAAIANKILVDILEEYFLEEEKQGRFIGAIKKYNLKGYDNTKKVIYDIYTRINKYLKKDKDDFLNHYEEKFLNENNFNRAIKGLMDECKQLVIKELINIYFFDQHYDDITNNNIDAIKADIDNLNNHDFDYSCFNFTNNEFCQEYYQKIKSFLEIDDFSIFIKTFYQLHEEKDPRAKKDDQTKVVLDRLHKIFRTDNCVLNKLLDVDPNLNGQYYQQFLSFKDDIALIIEIVKELDRRVEEYKNRSSLFSFNDIANKALELLTDPKYSIVQEELRKTYKFIMIDEYQDTNDLQEMVLDSLTTPYIDENGKSTRAHLFAVGDPKQSIYLFRNSKVELFNNRLKKYENDSDAEVIGMNKGYRSGPKLINDINYIFLHYMKVNNGGIDYTKNIEQLQYDKSTDQYGLYYNNFGVKRIIPTDINKNTNEVRISEIKAIIADILTKINTGYLVYDKEYKVAIKDQIAQIEEKITRSNNEKEKEILSNQKRQLLDYVIKNNEYIDDKIKNLDHLIALTNNQEEKLVLEKKKEYFLKNKDQNVKQIRPCRYNDFCILVRVATKGHIYEEAFHRYHIPFNIRNKTDLLELDPYILIESIITLIAGKMGLKENYDEKHLFMSIARSYAYRYDDEKLFSLIYHDTYKNDPLYLDIEQFIIRNKEATFPSLFLDLLNTFNVTKELYRTGDINGNMEKIDSIYQMVNNVHHAFEGLEHFVLIYESVKTNSLKIDMENKTQLDDAVDFMTIHASKGLERKIVYLPNSDNHFSAGSNMDKPDYVFSDDFGIILRNYQFSLDQKIVDKDGEEVMQPVYKKTLLETLINISNQDEIDEHVRLFYVALTRAQNTIYIVGNPSKIDKERNNGTLYGMLSYCPHYQSFNDELMQQLVNDQRIDQKDCDNYKIYNEALSDASNNHHQFADNIYYQDLYKTYYQDNLLTKISEIEYKIYSDLYQHFINHELKDIKIENDLDLCARLFGNYYFNIDLSSFDELVEYCKTKDDTKIIDDEDDESLPEQKENISLKDKIGRFIATFNKPIDQLSSKIFNILDLRYGDKDKKNDLDRYHRYVKALGTCFYRTFYHERDLFNLSFFNSDYDDETYYIDQSMLPKDINGDDVDLLKLTINNDQLNLTPKGHRRASKNVVISNQEVINYGLELHYLLELVDLSTFDTSFIKDISMKKKIDKVLKMDIFQNLNKKTYYQEYEYFDDEFNTSGKIDLLIIDNDQYHIIDYKSNNVDDPSYIDQLSTYKRNIKRLFKIDNEENIHLYLLSIGQNALKEIK